MVRRKLPFSPRQRLIKCNIRLNLDAFSNENGEINTELPRAKWKVTFRDKAKNSEVSTVISYDSLEDLESIIKMGMKEGMESTLERLDKFLLGLKN